MSEVDDLRAEVERLRRRTHEIADEQQRRFAPYVSRCERFDTLRKWAREHSGLVDPDGLIPDKTGSAWTYTSEAIRTLVVDALERAEIAEAKLAAVEALHCRGARESGEDWCDECGLAWPCATAKAIR